MPKAHSKKPSTQGAHHDVTRTDAALHPATPLEVMVSRALDQDLEWYHSYAEAALRRANLPMLPSYAVVTSEPTDDALRARAFEIADAVRTCLLAIGARHAEILRAVYTPRSWPTPVAKAFGPVAAIAVRIALADDPRPERHSREGIEQAAASRLAAAIVSKRVPVGRLRVQAERLLRGAIVAYAKARAVGPSAPPHLRCSRRRCVPLAWTDANR